MKLKRVLSGFMAAAVAITSSVVMTVSSNAAEDFVILDTAYNIKPYDTTLASNDSAYNSQYYASCNTFSESDLATYENMTFNVTFAQEALDFIGENAWRYGSLFTLSFQANGDYDSSWPALQVAGSQVIGFDGYTTTVTVDTPMDINVPIETILANLPEGYDHDTHFNNTLVFGGDWSAVTVNSISLTGSKDTTEYAWQSVAIPEPLTDSTNYALPGVFDTNQISGPGAGIELTLSLPGDGSTYAGYYVVDNTDGAWSTIHGGSSNKDDTTLTQFIKFSDFTGDVPTTAGTFVIACYSGATLSSIRIKNETGKTVYSENVDVPATAVTLDKERVTLDLGIEAQKTATLTATVEPDDTTDELKWGTSDATVVTVADGVLTAVGIGTATITATAGEQSDTCAVTVQKTSAITTSIGDGGTVSVASSAVNDDDVDVTVTPNDGYKLDTLTINGEPLTVTDGMATFTMPAEAVEIVATFIAIEYTITVADTTNGTVTVDPTTSTVGVEVLIKAEPDTYYVVDTMTANTKGGADVTVTDNVFKMPADDVTVNVTFALDDEALAYDIYQAVESLISGEVSSSTYKDKAAYVAAIEAAIADIDFDGLTVNADDIVFTAPTEEAAGSITGKINVSSGTIFETEVLELNVTIKAIPTDPVELAAEAVEAFLATYKATNDTDATALSEEMKALAAEASPNAITDVNVNFIPATYTEAGNVHFVITISAEGYDTKEITKDIAIAQLEKTDAMLIEEAKEAAEAAIADITAADDITKALITEAIANADITVDVKSEETTAPTTTAVGVQTVTITLTLGEESATITKTFDIAKLVAVESVSLDKTTAKLLAGETLTLTATVTPDDAADKSVTWESSDTAVATVADGVVTAVAAGDATITVTTTDGGKTASCAVTVTAPVEPDEPEPEPDEPTIPEDEIVIWTGSTDLGTDWGTSITATFDVSKLAAGDTVKVYYTAGTAATYQQVKLMDANWTPLTSPTGMNEWDCVDLAADKTEYSFAISAADVKALNGTMIVSGYNATITGISIIPAASEDEPASGYTDDDTTIPVGKTMTQKTAVSDDGYYNQRFVQKVSVADLANATKIVFTVSNGTKTVKYESTECYSSLNVNGGALDAGDGYVYVVLTIKDIPDGKNVTIDSIDIV